LSQRVLYQQKLLLFGTGLKMLYIPSFNRKKILAVALLQLAGRFDRSWIRIPRL